MSRLCIAAHCSLHAYCCPCCLAHTFRRSLNSSLNLLNKWSLGVYGFRFPFLLTSCERRTCDACHCAAAPVHVPAAAAMHIAVLLA